MTRKRVMATAGAFGFYALFAFEILYMVSPFALQFYSVYGPFLNLFHKSRWTAWLTGFFLPHVSKTGDPILNQLPALGEPMIAIGLVLFVIAFVQVYGSKLLRRGAVTGGLYRIIRHPQYSGLAIAGLGLLIRWPRFFVALSYTLMLVTYGLLARYEERECLARFGDPYEKYLRRIGRFIPAIGRGAPAPVSVRQGLVTFAAVAALTLITTLALREHSLANLHAVWNHDSAVISPAPLASASIERAFSLTANAVERPRKVLAYVVPEEWYLADLPVDSLRPDEWRKVHGHRTPSTFDGNKLKVLITEPRSYNPEARGKEIVRNAWGRKTVAVVHVDLRKGAVVAVERAPAHVLWGDIPTPLF